MAVTQYIGSRYVPLFADPAEWSSTKEYEPLTIVLHEGSSYTSKQFVPVGIDITNTDFWARTGDYNAQVELYRRETQQAVAQINDWYDDAVTEYADKYGAKPFAFDTVADMQAASDLLYVGAICHTNGFHTAGDGGSAWYLITDSGNVNNMDVIRIDTAKRAHLIISKSSVTPEMFGAMGDGVNDDTGAFQRAFEVSRNVACPELAAKKTYAFGSPINSRSNTLEGSFDGGNNYFKNFSLELALADNSYTWRSPYNWRIFEVRNCTFGYSYDAFENNPALPAVISGMPIKFTNIVMQGKLVLLAYTDTYIDNLYLKNVTLSHAHNDNVMRAYKDYNAIMRIKSDGTLVKFGSGSGDSWLFEQVHEFKPTYVPEDNDAAYALITTRGNNSITLLNCIQNRIEVSAYANVSLIGCHFEGTGNAGVVLLTPHPNSLISFDNCYIYASATYPIDSAATYANCFFRMDSAARYTKGVSLLANANINNCYFGSTYLVESSLPNTDALEQCNYLNYTETTDIVISDPTQNANATLVGDLEITVFVKRIDGNIYSKMQTKNATVDANSMCRIRINNCTSSIIEIYVKNGDGTIYCSKLYVDKPFASIIITSYGTFFSVERNKRPNYPDAIVYPKADTCRVVQSVPNYEENTTVYRLSSGSIVDTNDAYVSNKYARIASASVAKGSGY